VRADVERLAMLRHDLRRLGVLVRGLSPDQRLVLASQFSQALDREAFCRVNGWSGEKYRKVSQRARARLRALLAGESAGSHTCMCDRHPSHSCAGGTVPRSTRELSLGSASRASDSRTSEPLTEKRCACPVESCPSDKGAGTHL
jgi:hypothetical protein